ncbi:MAG: UDP-2,3-diacylglucosamine hydrolase [Pseudomonadota bacterium]|jgi:UDP-2,3-diacylglucosamine hydrolase
MALLSLIDARHWSRIEFISDIHLQSSEPANFAAWSRYMSHVRADALFILGDLFEVWVGDDVLDHPQGVFEQECLAVIQQTSLRMPVYWLVGNRDFLLSDRALEASGMQALNDPCVLETTDARCLLSHGDALCVADTDYQAFRQTVRSADWQKAFLSQPLNQRMQTARALRQQSEARKALQTEWVDVDDATAMEWLRQQHCSVLIHGHTHQAACHPLAEGHVRWVLSDWDAAAAMPRLQALRWEATTGFAPLALT